MSNCEVNECKKIENEWEFAFSLCVLNKRLKRENKKEKKLNNKKIYKDKENCETQ